MDLNSYDIFNVSELILEGDFDAQVDQLLGHIRLSREQVLGLSELYNDLEETLGMAWPGCQVYAFGSIVNGLAIKTSDADCFIDIPEEIKPHPKTCAKIAKGIFNRYPHKFKKVFGIFNAKVPIVQFYYAPLNIHCDVSFSSKCGAMNSDLIGFLLSIDRRALKLAILVKYWSKVHCLSGTNLLANYALLLMIVFYLQQKHVLPSYKSVMMPQEIVNGWYYGYDKSEADNFVPNDSLTLYELLGGFFQYYRDFEFDKYIVNPFSGYPVERQRFSDIDSVPSEFSQYIENVNNKVCYPFKIDTPFCIQDLLEHNSNCTKAVHSALAIKLRDFITFGANLYERSCNTFLLDILKEIPTNYIGSINPSRRARNHKNYIKRKNKNKQQIKLNFTGKKTWLNEALTNKCKLI